MIRKYNLDNEVIGYVLSQLSQGNTLSKYLMELPFEEGEFITYLPENRSEDLKKFKRGGIAILSEVRPVILNQILSFIQYSCEDTLVIFESLAQPGDEYLTVTRSKFFCFDNEVYYSTYSKMLNYNKLLTLMKEARGYPLIGIVSHSDYCVSKLIYREVGERRLRALALGTRYLFVGAYDNESILIWKRGGIG